MSRDMESDRAHSSEPDGPPRLDFAVIGVQKGGTTTLWELLRHHPRIWLPEDKEMLLFSLSWIYQRGVSRALSSAGAPVDARRLIGCVTPHYMHGWHDSTTATIAARMAHSLPDLRLIALLRDPVERARSAHAMSFARGRDRRSFDEAIRAELHPDALRLARFLPHDTNTYVVQGEYGRILGEYLRFFPPRSLHVEFTSDLASDPLGVVSRVLDFLGLGGEYVPPEPGLRLFAGGTSARVAEDEALRALELIVETEAGQRVRALGSWAAEHDLNEDATTALRRIATRYEDAAAPLEGAQAAGARFLLTKIWNIAPSPLDPVADDVREQLEAHYAGETGLLRAVTGRPIPWQRVAEQSRPKSVVYTAIAGGSSELIEPESVAPGWDYVCFTDDPYLHSSVWQIRPLESMTQDPCASRRRAKVLSHLHLLEYEATMWVDPDVAPPGSRDLLRVDGIGTQPLAILASGTDLDRTAVVLRRGDDATLAGLMTSWLRQAEVLKQDDQALLRVAGRRRRGLGTVVSGDDPWPVSRPGSTASHRRSATLAAIQRSQMVILGTPASRAEDIGRFFSAYVSAAQSPPGGDPTPLPSWIVTNDHLDVFGDRPRPPQFLDRDLLLDRRLIVVVDDPRDLFMRSSASPTRSPGRMRDRLDILADCPVYGIERISASVSLLLDLFHEATGDRLLVFGDRLSKDPDREFERALRFTLAASSPEEGALAAALRQMRRRARRRRDASPPAMPPAVLGHVQRLPATRAVLRRLAEQDAESTDHLDDCSIS